MGLFDFVKSELIDVIEWVDSSNDTIIWKFPRKNGDHEIKNNAKLTVRESQQAVFLNEGVLADVFKPGMHTLQTQNMPILATLKGWKYGFDSPFKADVYFVSTKQFVDQKWGTKNPITIDDERFGMIEVRAFGNFSYRVSDAGLFLKEIAGTDTHFTTDEISDQLKTKVLRKFTDIAASTPDLNAYLILVIEVLGKLTNMEFDTGPGQKWAAHAKALKSALIAELWNGESFIGKNAYTGEASEPDEFLSLIPIVLGSRLPQEIISKLAAKITLDVTDSAVGLLMAGGLFDAGEKDAARKIAQQALEAVRNNGIKCPFYGASLLALSHKVLL